MENVSCLSESVSKLLLRHRAACMERLEELRGLYGSTESYRKTLTLEIIDRPNDRRLEEFYQLYKTTFTLEDECEPIDGFATVLGFNRNTEIQSEFGPFTEPIFLLRESKSKHLVAAANFAVYAYPRQKNAYFFDASCQLNFLLVREDRRGCGIAVDLLHHIEKYKANFAELHCQCHCSFTTCEQNNPLKMTENQIETDAIAALIDPHDRMRWWHRRGFRRLELPYVQPPLQPDLEPCRYLDYYICLSGMAKSNSDSVPSAVVREHLRRFFFVSVGKCNVDIDKDPDWRNITEFLSRTSNVSILEAGKE